MCKYTLSCLITLLIGASFCVQTLAQKGGELPGKAVQSSPCQGAACIVVVRHEGDWSAGACTRPLDIINKNKTMDAAVRYRWTAPIGSGGKPITKEETMCVYAHRKQEFLCEETPTIPGIQTKMTWTFALIDPVPYKWIDSSAHFRCSWSETSTAPPPVTTSKVVQSECPGPCVHILAAVGEFCNGDAATSQYLINDSGKTVTVQLKVREPDNGVYVFATKTVAAHSRTPLGCIGNMRQLFVGSTR